MIPAEIKYRPLYELTDEKVVVTCPFCKSDGLRVVRRKHGEFVGGTVIAAERTPPDVTFFEIPADRFYLCTNPKCRAMIPRYPAKGFGPL